MLTYAEDTLGEIAVVAGRTDAGGGVPLASGIGGVLHAGRAGSGGRTSSTDGITL